MNLEGFDHFISLKDFNLSCNVSSELNLDYLRILLSKELENKITKRSILILR